MNEQEKESLNKAIKKQLKLKKKEFEMINTDIDRFALFTVDGTPHIAMCLGVEKPFWDVLTVEETRALLIKRPELARGLKEQLQFEEV